MNSKTLGIADLLSQTLLLMAIFCLIVALASYLKGRRERNSYRPANARVTKISSETLKVKDQSGEVHERGPFSIVFVEFENHLGAKIVTRLRDVLPKVKKHYAVGTIVPIEYQEQASRQIREAEFLNKYGLEVFLIICAALFLFSSFLVSFFSKDFPAFPAAMNSLPEASNVIPLIISGSTRLDSSHKCNLQLEIIINDFVKIINTNL